MKGYIATVDNKPFFSQGDFKTQADWLTALNLSSDNFQTLVINNQMKAYDNGLNINMNAQTGRVEIFRPTPSLSASDMQLLSDYLTINIATLNNLLPEVKNP